MGSSPLMSSTPTWDSPTATWDSAGATWDATPAPPAPKPKKRPFHRSPKPNIPTPPLASTTMPTFKYNIAPKAASGFTTRVAKGATETTETMLNAVSTQTGVPQAQVEAVLRAFFNRVLACSAGCLWAPNVLDLVSFRPTSGGSSPLPDGFHNADDIKADVSLSFTAEAIRQWRSTLTLESLGEVGKVTPEIDSIIRQSDSAVNKYTPGGLIQLRGDYLDLNTTDPTQGVFFTPASGAEVRATEYASPTPQGIVVLVPAALSGTLSVRVASFINGSVRSYTYTSPLTTP